MKKRNNDNDKCKTSKQQRRKKLYKFQDRMHRMFGNPAVAGMGEGMPSICDYCHEHTHRTTGTYDYKLKKMVYRCKHCKGTE